MDRAIQFGDAVIVEVSGSSAGEPVSGATMISRKFDEVTSAVGSVLQPLLKNVAGALHDGVESCEVQLSFSFTAEGRLFVCRTSGESSIVVRAKLRVPT